MAVTWLHSGHSTFSQSRLSRPSCRRFRILGFALCEHRLGLQLDAHDGLAILDVAVRLVGQLAVADEASVAKALLLVVGVHKIANSVFLWRKLAEQDQFTVHFAGPLQLIVVVAEQVDAQMLRLIVSLRGLGRIVRLNQLHFDGPLQTLAPEAAAVTLVPVGLEELRHVEHLELERNLAPCDVHVLDRLLQLTFHRLQTADQLSLAPVELFAQMIEFLGETASGFHYVAISSAG